MESKVELNEIYVKNGTCCYFDDTIRFWDRDNDSSGILFDQKLYLENYRNILIHDISCKTSPGTKPLHNRYDEVDRFIKIYNGIECLVLLGYNWFDKICYKIKYRLSDKSCIKESINQNFARIRIRWYNSLPIEKILTFHNIIVLIVSYLKG